MATQQGEGGVPFSIAHDLHQFRLLELPAELLELIDSPNPPRLSIKSQAPPTSTAAPGTKPAYAVLCTPNKTFQLRQVQTSNSVFVTQPVLEANGTDIPVPTTRAIASCTATLELHPTDASATTLLEEALPLYDIVDGEVDASGNGRAKSSIFRDVPLSDGQCEGAWNELLAFELAGSTWRPSANTLMQVWRSIIEAAAAESVKLDKQFLTEDILSALDAEAYPASLISAILRHLASDTDKKNEPWSCLDRTRTIAFIGKTLLEAKLVEQEYLTAIFIDDWKDALPELWRSEVELNLIDGSFTLPSNKTIRSKKEVAARAQPNTSAPKTGSSSRKWHERFGRARKG